MLVSHVDLAFRGGYTRGVTARLARGLPRRGPDVLGLQDRRAWTVYSLRRPAMTGTDMHRHVVGVAVNSAVSSRVAP